MIKEIFVRKGRFDFAHPEEYQVDVHFVTSDGSVSSTLPLERAEHLLGWDGDNPVELLREVLRINKKAYLFDSRRKELEQLLKQCEAMETQVQLEWLERKREWLKAEIQALEKELRRVENKIQSLGGGVV